MTIKAVDLFCGVGGLTYGLQKAGIPVVAGIDIDDSCEYAYTHNNNCTFIHKSVENVTGKEIRALLRGADVKIRKPRLCQFFRYTQSVFCGTTICG